MKRLAVRVQDAFLLRRGRVVAALLLLILACAKWAGEPAQADAGRGPWITVPFASLRQLLFDSYQRALPRVRLNDSVTIVEVDEESLKSAGQWPWPRNRIAQLVDAIAAHRPAAIGLDMYMPEPDQTSPGRVAANLPPQAGHLVAQLQQLPSHDLRLAEAMRGAPVVLSATGFETKTLATESGLQTRPLAVAGPDPMPWLQRFPQALVSMPELQGAAHGQGVVWFDPTDAVVRRLPIVVGVGEQVVASFAAEMLRVAYAQPSAELRVGRHGVQELRLGEQTIPTQASGDLWLHFALRSNAQPRQVSAADVLAGRVPSEKLAGRMVLVGLTGLGLSDVRLTALGEAVPGIEVQAQALESVIDGRLLLRPWWMRHLEFWLLLTLGAAMVWLIPFARRRAGERRRRWAGAVFVVSGSLVAAGFALFWGQGWLFDAAGVVAGLGLLASSLWSSAVLEIERDNLRLARERERLREEAALVAGELEAARRIQMGSLPDARRLFPQEKRFEVAALMEPAREVGGDLYDFFLIDEHRLCVVIGDVSGKGLPASLFMTVVKTLTRSFAMRLRGSPGDVVAAANADLSRENGGQLFATLLLGVLDLRSGELELVNAGHNPAWRVDAEGQVAKVVTARGAGGPPLGVIENFPYASQKVQLAEGDTVFFVTDGIAEAANESGELYGNARLEVSLARLPANADAEGEARCIRDRVAAFVGAAEASDDLTLLVLRWHGAQPAQA